jgi:hypothetical protein
VGDKIKKEMFFIGIALFIAGSGIFVTTILN